MAYHVKLSDLANMPVVDSNRVLGELVRSAKSRRNGQSAVLDARISDYELRYEMSSGDMRRRLKDGTLRETADIARWLMTLAARDNCGTAK
jgi:hypothetical protein